ncbi:MAG: aspartate aminotransferase family protein [Eubacteriaceae bacterium]|nr:aspartate aminotransferase family protein [Eubacteriaceae bacterium]
MTDLFVNDKTYIANTYSRFDIAISSGKGSVAEDYDGKEYIDMGSGIGVTSFGYCDEEWAEAVTKQINTLQHTSNLYYTSPCVNLAKLLCEKTGMDKVFFGNSGAEANECAIKVARKYACENKGEDYYTIVTLDNSFHGRTLTTLAATGQDKYHENFQPLTAGFVHTPANDIEALKEVVRNNKVAGIMIECVQGEGGVNALDGDFIRGVDDICKENDIVFIVDEVQTGNGRTGKMYSYMHFGVSPDVVTTAKGLGGGLPIGACIMASKVSHVLGYGDHGSTYGGNPVASAGAVSIISRLDDELFGEVTAKSKYVFDELTGAKGISSVSGLGLMIGILPEGKTASQVVSECMKKGVLCLTAKDKVRLLPALNIPWECLKKAVAVIKEVCGE